MTVIKRDGRAENYDSQKISNAIRKAFLASDERIDDDKLCELVKNVEKMISSLEYPEVEFIQDKVEEALMDAGFFKTAKRYILFREQRSQLREERRSLLGHLKEEAIEPILLKIQSQFDSKEYSLKILENKFLSFFKEGMSDSEKLDALTKAAVELTKPETPKWEIIGARFLSYSFKKKMRKSLEKRKIETFSQKVEYLAEEGLYGQ